MPDGSSGLSLSEMGVAVKKTVQAVKKTTGPASQQVKTQLGGTFVPGQTVQLPSSQPPSESAPKQAGGFDISSIFGETNPFTSSSPKQNTGQQSQDPQQAVQAEQQKAEDKKKIESLRQKLHQMYYEEFIRKAEGKDKAQDAQVKRKEQVQQEEEEKKNQVEEKMQPIMLSQSPKKGFLGMKKVKNSIMNAIRPKTGSHEGKSSKG